MSLITAGLACGSSSAPPGSSSFTPQGGLDGGTSFDGGTGPTGATGSTGSTGPTGPLGGGDWLQYRYAPQAGASENPGVFATTEVQNLTPLWTIAGYPADSTLGQYVYTQAMITGDTLYVTTAFGGKVVALNAASGAVRWTRTINGLVDPGCTTPSHLGFWAAPAVAAGVVYVAAADGKVYALSAADGSTQWSVQVADPTATGRGQFIESSPSVSTALGKLYVGIASSAGCAEVAGRIASVDLNTHAVQYADLTDPGKFTGAVWTSISIDEAAGAIFATTGTGKQPPTLSPTSLGQAVVKLDARSLAVVDHWQNPCPLSDCDFGGSPALFTAADGRQLVAATAKDGYLYVLNRASLAAGPIWKYQLAVIDPAKPTEGGDATAGWGTLVSPSFAHGTLYAGGGHTPSGEAGSVVAFDPATGAVKWRHLAPGYVLSSLPAVGDVLLAVSNAPDNTVSTLEVLDQATGTALRSFPGTSATYQSPSVGHGLIFWSDANGRATALVVPHYR